MKSLTGVVLAMSFVLGAAPSYAQVGGGVLGGANFSKGKISGQDAEGVETKSQTGLIVGGFLTVPLGSSVTMMPEVAYSRKPFKIEFSDGVDSFSQKIKLDFISIPVLFKFGPQGGGFYVVAGPGFNFRTKAKATDSEFNGQPEPEGNEDLKDQTESFDLSLLGGAGFAMGNFGIEGRYDHGLRNLNKEDDEDFKVKTRAFTVMVKIYFK